MMVDPDFSSGGSPTRRPRRRSKGWSLRLTSGGLLLLFLVNALILAGLAWPLVQARLALPSLSIVGLPDESQLPQTDLPLFTPTQTLSPSQTVTDTPTQLPSNTSTPFTSPQIVPGWRQGLMILALQEGQHSHLFAYQPQDEQDSPGLPLVRLTSGPWDDLAPAISPDGLRVVFTSNRNGYWDLYIISLDSGLVTRLTNTFEYEGAPSWSPDGFWVVYEAYLEENLEVVIYPIDGSQDAIRLTHHPAADYAPVWSPQGRQIAFVSTRSGEAEIWLADLDRVDESLFINLSQNPTGRDVHPAWSPDGCSLAWAAVESGFHNLYIWDSEQPDLPGRVIGSGDWPVWSPDSSMLLSALYAPSQDYLTAYPLHRPGVVVPPLLLPGRVQGLAWGSTTLEFPLQEPLRQAAELTPTPLWNPALTPHPDNPTGRRQVVLLEDVQAPHPYLHDLVDESFNALRRCLATDIGWDYLSSLENAYVPLTSPLEPGMGDSWLYTGRAFASTTLPINAGWLVVVREDFGMQTYWRVYLRTRFQDGSIGMPLHDLPWDFDSRFDGDPAAYERGGNYYQDLLQGYWVDFTQLALAYGWERLPALPNWNYAFSAARFNEYVLRDSLDWRLAMLELYPPEAMVTPSPVIPPTQTPTLTPWGYQTPTPTLTPTPRPTRTPPPPTATSTRTSVPTITPTPTFTRTFPSTPRTPASSPTYTPSATAQPGDQEFSTP